MVTHKIVNGNYRIVNGNYRIVNGNYRIVNGKIVNGTARPPKIPIPTEFYSQICSRHYFYKKKNSNHFSQKFEKSTFPASESTKKSRFFSDTSHEFESITIRKSSFY